MTGPRSKKIRSSPRACMGRPPGWIPRPLGASQNTPRPVCPISPPGPRCPRPHAAIWHGGGGVLCWRCLTYAGKIQGLAGIFSYLECRRNPPQFVPGAKAGRENHTQRPKSPCSGPRSFSRSCPTSQQYRAAPGGAFGSKRPGGCHWPQRKKSHPGPIHETKKGWPQLSARRHS